MVDNTMSKEIFRESKNNMNQFAQTPLPHHRFFTFDTCHYWCFKGYEVINNCLYLHHQPYFRGEMVWKLISTLLLRDPRVGGRLVQYLSETRPIRCRKVASVHSPHM